MSINLTKQNDKPYEECDDETSVAIATEFEQAYLESGNAGLLKQAAALMNGLYEQQRAPYRVLAASVATTQPERCRENKHTKQIRKLNAALHEIDTELFEYLKRYVTDPDDFDAVTSLVTNYCETARQLGRESTLA